jgi:hypothetical protein
MHPLSGLAKQDISTLQRIGHFYFALTRDQLALTGDQLARVRKLTIGMDLGDRVSRYCILNEEGDIIFEGSIWHPDGCVAAICH